MMTNYIEIIAKILPYYDANVLELIDTYVKNIDRSFTLELETEDVSECSLALADHLIVNYFGSEETTIAIKFEGDGTITKNAIDDEYDMTYYSKFSYNKEMIADCCHDGSVKLLTVWGNNIKTLEGHEECVLCCSFSHDNKMIVSCSDDKTARLWDIEFGECIKIINLADEPEFCDFSSNGIIMVGYPNSSIQMWDLRTGECTSIMAKSLCQSPNVTNGLSGSFSPDGILLSLQLSDKWVIWNLETKECVDPFNLDDVHRECPNFVKCCEFSPDGKMIVASYETRHETRHGSSYESAIGIWNTESFELMRSFKCRSATADKCLFSPDGKMVAAIYDEIVKIWNIETGNLLVSSNIEWDFIDHCMFSKDSKMFVIHPNPEHLACWDIEYLSNKIMH